MLFSEVAIGAHGIAGLQHVDDGRVREEHDQHRDEETGEEDGDDVGFVDGGVVGLVPVNLTSAISMVWGKHFRGDKRIMSKIIG